MALAFTEENGCCAEIVQKKEPKTLKCARSPELILGNKMQQPHKGSSDVGSCYRCLLLSYWVLSWAPCASL